LRFSHILLLSASKASKNVGVLVMLTLIWLLQTMEMKYHIRSSFGCCCTIFSIIDYQSVVQRWWPYMNSRALDMICTKRMLELM
jgi:hypothetical protein